MKKQTIDITEEQCPMTFVRVKLKMEGMAVGETLSVLLKEGPAVENLPRTLREEGWQTSEPILKRDTIYEMNVTK
ncbi:sulfurtransferase TusA family protein [Magnetococcales bacterium HHB-1]